MFAERYAYPAPKADTRNKHFIIKVLSDRSTGHTLKQNVLVIGLWDYCKGRMEMDPPLSTRMNVYMKGIAAGQLHHDELAPVHSSFGAFELIYIFSNSSFKVSNSTRVVVTGVSSAAIAA